jgi:hypothetical protein
MLPTTDHRGKQRMTGLLTDGFCQGSHGGVDSSDLKERKVDQ